MPSKTRSNLILKPPRPKAGSVFHLESAFKPTGDQPRAIESLVSGFEGGQSAQTLLGVTGSGKTFSMANVISALGKKTLVLAPNKTLAAQLYAEFKEFFPKNAVEYFVSYYDYYQPEAYVVATDTYIEKDSSINDEIDKLRHSTTRSLLEREDVIVVASVSCIYGIGSPSEYQKQKAILFVGDELPRDDFLKTLTEMQYQRNDVDFTRGCFRVRGDCVEVFPSYEDSQVVRVEFFDDCVESISLVDPLRGKVLGQVARISLYPKSHYVVGKERLQKAIASIRAELAEHLKALERQGKLVERQRLEQRTMHDLEMLEEIGLCSGIENYSRHLTGTQAGQPPPTLLDFFAGDFLLIVDESHIACPQVGGMYRGDRARKENLVEHGFRLPSALDNRPLRFEEFETRLDQVLFVSATPGEYELKCTGGEYAEQIIRPTGLLDPLVEIRPAKSQVDDVLAEARKVIAEGFRVLITTLTKRLAEELTSYFSSEGMRIRYLHSDIKTLERMEILRDLRTGEFDILVGINLLREGLDLPEVALVGILDADKEGFLRSERSLIQTIGRAARNSEGRVILYAYRETASMQRAMGETRRRRKLQEAHNAKHGIVPASIKKAVSGGVIETLRGTLKTALPALKDEGALDLEPESLEQRIELLRKRMKALARDLRFEEAAGVREEIKALTEARLILS